MKDDESESTLWDNQFKEDVKSGRFFWLTNKHVMDFERGHFKDFWMLYEKLSNDTKKLADEAFALLKENPKNQSGLNALSISCEAIALSAKLLYPVMPKKCEEIFNILGVDKTSINNLDFETISENSITPHKALFPRIENDD